MSLCARTLCGLVLGVAFTVRAEPIVTQPEQDAPVPSIPEALVEQWTPESSVVPPPSAERVRTKDERVERLTLREAIAVGLENNPQVAAERLGPTFARTEIERTRSIFDPRFTFFAENRRRVTPTGSALAGADQPREEQVNYEASIEKFLRTGANLEIDFVSEELQSNSDFFGLVPQYRPELTFSITQPLLRDFGPNLSVLLVRSAEAGSTRAYYEYVTEVAGFVRDVVEAYWAVVGARETVAAERDGLELAKRVLEENRVRVRTGVLPPVAVKEAEADVARREEQVIVAENQRDVAIERLRLLLRFNPEDAFVPRTIEPIDSPEVRDVRADPDEALENAIEHRPELARARAEIKSKNLVARVRRNEILPKLDLEASYGLNGLSGRAVPQRDFRTGETRFSPFGGDYLEGIDRLFSQDFESHGAGIRLEVPLGNAGAEAEHAQASIDVRRSKLSYRELLSDVTLEVRQAVRDVQANSKRITATRVARELAQENLDQQRKRHEAGRATTKDLLDFQEDLTRARAREVEALIDYNVSLASLRRAQGTLLEEHDVLVKELPPPPTPIWARF